MYALFWGRYRTLCVNGNHLETETVTQIRKKSKIQKKLRTFAMNIFDRTCCL